MATGTETTTPPANPSRGVVATEPPDRIIERQLRRARRQVKLVDLFTVLMILTAGVLAAVLVLVIIDHWLFGLGFWGRLLAFAGLCGGGVWYGLRHVLPLLLCSINPVYAARAIEQSTPSLKNSLINFLLFRANGGTVHRIVYEAMRHRAATDLNAVAVETAVDRSRLIRVGYVLAGVLFVCGLYVILSPKDAFRTVSRVAAPWAEIARPARVDITDVLPGDAQVYQGQTQAVSCQIRGISHGDAVTLLFSTADGQLIGQEVAMHVTEGGLRYTCSLPPGENGIQQNLVYRIRAGDALTRPYELDVSPAPTILVEQVEYVYPAYTQLAPRIERGGDIRALEGTQVTVLGRANYSIRAAFLEFDPPHGAGSEEEAARPSERLPMEIDDTAARRSFILEMQPDRRTPRYSGYQLVFQTSDGHPSENHVLHRIDVTLDLAPEVQILTPAKDRVEVPEDGEQKIEVRALDPDFGLSQVRLRSVTGGVDLLDEPLLQTSEGRTGQLVVTYTFRPRDLKLVAGDQVVYWAVAEDNRTATLSDLPEPNVERTRNYHILITAARENRKEPPAGESQPESSPAEKPSEAGSEGEQADGTGQGGTGGSDQGGQSSPDEMEPNGEGQGTSGEAGASETTASEAEDAGQDDASGGSDAEPGAPPPDQPNDEQSGERGSPQGKPNAETGDNATGDQRSEPLHDGEVFERALERLKEQQQNDGGSDTQPDNSESEAENTQTRPKPGTGDTSRNPDSGGQAADTETEPRDTGSSERERTPPGQMSDPATEPGGGTSEGETGKPSQDPQSDLANPGPSGQDPSKTPNEPEGSSGTSQPPGTRETEAGRPGEQTEATGANDVPDQGHSEPERPTEAPGTEDATSRPNQRERPSDSPRESSGEQPGEGQQKPGPGAPPPGQDGAGSDHSGEADASNATEAGDGDATTSPGEKQATDKPPGAGAPDPSIDAQNPLGEDGQAPQPKPGQGREPARGGGAPSDDVPSKPFDSMEVADGDKPRLDYARRVTDLVLEYLEDQQESPDQRLLEELDWTENDMRKFLERWRRLKGSAGEDEAGRHELDENLRSLGLRPARERLRQGTGADDDLRGMRQNGAHTSMPKRYADQYDAFKKGAARQQD